MSYVNEKPVEAYILSLLAGLAISLVGLVWLSMMFTGAELNWFGFMMHGYDDHLLFVELGTFGYTTGLVGLITGVGIIGTAILLQSKPESHATWGSIIIVLSAFSLFGGMGGMGIGLILGLVGGILAITWMPNNDNRLYRSSVENQQ